MPASMLGFLVLLKGMQNALLRCEVLSDDFEMCLDGKGGGFTNVSFNVKIC